MLLQTLRVPPPVGSLQECALALLLDRLEDVEHAKFRAMAQITIDKEEGIKAFADYTKIAFPALALKKKREEENLKKQLDAWTKAGPLRVTPGPEFTAQSKLKKKSMRAQNENNARVMGRPAAPRGSR